MMGVMADGPITGPTNFRKMIGIDPLAPARKRDELHSMKTLCGGEWVASNDKTRRKPKKSKSRSSSKTSKKSKRRVADDSESSASSDSHSFPLTVRKQPSGECFWIQVQSTSRISTCMQKIQRMRGIPSGNIRLKVVPSSDISPSSPVPDCSSIDDKGDSASNNADFQEGTMESLGIRKGKKDPERSSSSASTSSSSQPPFFLELAPISLSVRTTKGRTVLLKDAVDVECTIEKLEELIRSRLISEDVKEYTKNQHMGLRLSYDFTPLQKHHPITKYKIQNKGTIRVAFVEPNTKERVAVEEQEVRLPGLIRMASEAALPRSPLRQSPQRRKLSLPPSVIAAAAVSDLDRGFQKISPIIKRKVWKECKTRTATKETKTVKDSAKTNRYRETQTLDDAVSAKSKKSPSPKARMKKAKDDPNEKAVTAEDESKKKILPSPNFEAKKKGQVQSTRRESRGARIKSPEKATAKVRTEIEQESTSKVKRYAKTDDMKNAIEERIAKAEDRKALAEVKLNADGAAANKAKGVNRTVTRRKARSALVGNDGKKHSTNENIFIVNILCWYGDLIEINGISRETSINEIKDKLVQKIALPKERQRLLKSGNELNKNDMSLRDYGIRNNETLLLDIPNKKSETESRTISFLKKAAGYFADPPTENEEKHTKVASGCDSTANAIVGVENGVGDHHCTKHDHDSCSPTLSSSEGYDDTDISSEEEKSTGEDKPRSKGGSDGETMYGKNEVSFPDTFVSLPNRNDEISTDEEHPVSPSESSFVSSINGNRCEHTVDSGSDENDGSDCNDGENTIIVITPDFTPVAIPIDSPKTIKEIKPTVSDVSGIPLSQIRLAKCNNEITLNDSFRLSSGDILTVHPSTIVVKMPDCTKVELSVFHKAQVGEIKDYIQDRTGIRRSKQSMSFVGDTDCDLKDSTPIESDCTLQMTMKGELPLMRILSPF